MSEKIQNLISLILDAIVLVLIANSIAINVQRIMQFSSLDSIVKSIALLIFLYIVVNIAHRDWKQMINLTCN